MHSFPQTQGGQAPYWQRHKKIKDKTIELAVLQIYRKILKGGRNLLLSFHSVSGFPLANKSA